MIAIIDYGMGNIHSVQKALESMSFSTLVTNRPADIQACDKMVLPGVGAFGDAMAEIEKQKLTRVIKEQIKKNKPFLGICLGMHLLFEASEESPKVKGLAILKGVVKKFVIRDKLKVPHMGWNQLKVKSHPLLKRQRMSAECLDGGQISNIKSECPLLKEIAEDSYVYFCHSYYPDPRDKSVIAATTDYINDFTAILWKNNVYGVQFHPEKSQSIGLKILENFVRL